MKAGKEHRVPLSDAALALLGRCGCIARASSSFRQQRRASRSATGAASSYCAGWGAAISPPTASGRTFRDWAAEQTAYPNELLEIALAHAVGDKVEAAYRRGDMLEKRRRLMEDWGRYCGSIPAATTDNVVTLR